MSTILITLAVFLGSVLGPPPEYVPAGEEAYTLDLQADGYVNGAMDGARLMSYRGCTLERDAAYMYALLMEAAERDGVGLGWEDCYRSYAAQAASYNDRCPYQEVPVYQTDPITGEQLQVGTRAQRVCSGPSIARPGLSNHGWGRAVDFTDGRAVLGCNDRAFRWLQGNAYRFGWVHPRWAGCDQPTREPWHWEWAGVTSPNLVGYYQLNEQLLGLLE